MTDPEVAEVTDTLRLVHGVEVILDMSGTSPPLPADPAPGPAVCPVEATPRPVPHLERGRP